MYVILLKVLGSCLTFFVFSFVGIPLIERKWGKRIAQLIHSLILSIVLGFTLYPGYKQFDYEHLIIKNQQRAYIPRIMESGDRIPETVFCLENDTAIIEVLGMDTLIDALKREMYEKDLPCIAPYYLRKQPTDFASVPNLLMFNRRYIEENRFGINFINTGELLYGFNCRRVGGSIESTIEVTSMNEICKWPIEKTVFMNLYERVQCQIPTIFHGKTKIITVSLPLSGEWAFCFQAYENDINQKDGKICSYQPQ